MDEDLRLAAKKSLDRMLEMAGRTVGQGDVGKPIFSGSFDCVTRTFGTIFAGNSSPFRLPASTGRAPSSLNVMK